MYGGKINEIRIVKNELLQGRVNKIIWKLREITDFINLE